MATLALLKRHMAPRGWLLVGYAEPNMEMFKAFESVTTADSTAYRNPGPDKTVAAGNTSWLAPSFPDVPARSSSLPRPKIHSEIVPKTIQEPTPTVDDVRMLADTGHWDAASRLTEKLIQTDTLNPGGHFISALIHEHLGASDKALVALKRAIYLDRRFALAHYHLGTSLANVNQMESASRSFHNTLEILTTMADDEPLPHGDSITAGELRTLTNMHLEMNQR
jgi:chemotaxis protein methyltransferase CheR